MAFNFIYRTSAIATIVLVAGFNLPAEAVTISTSASIPSTLTDYINEPFSLGLSQFNPTMGTLNSVTVDLAGDVTSNGGFENLNATPTTVTFTSGALIEFLVDGASLLQVQPSRVYNYNLPRYDRVLDFGGASGRTVSGLTASAVTSTTLTTNLTSFIGIGTVNAGLSASSVSSIAAPGNLSSFLNTFAGGTVTLTYDYTPQAIPEPLTVMGVITALGFGVGFKRKLKR